MSGGDGSYMGEWDRLKNESNNPEAHSSIYNRPTDEELMTDEQLEEHKRKQKEAAEEAEYQRSKKQRELERKQSRQRQRSMQRQRERQRIQQEERADAVRQQQRKIQEKLRAQREQKPQPAPKPAPQPAPAPKKERPKAVSPTWLKAQHFSNVGYVDAGMSPREYIGDEEDPEDKREKQQVLELLERVKERQKKDKKLLKASRQVPVWMAVTGEGVNVDDVSSGESDEDVLEEDDRPQIYKDLEEVKLDEPPPENPKLAEIHKSLQEYEDESDEEKPNLGTDWKANLHWKLLVSTLVAGVLFLLVLVIIERE